MGRVTRYPPKPKTKYLHEVIVQYTEVDQTWIWKDAARFGGIAGYNRQSTSWATTRVGFDTQERADALKGKLCRWRHEQELADLRRRPWPVAARYAEAALAQHGLVWGLSTDHIRPIVQAYRLSRLECSTHESPNWKATEVLVGFAPSIDFDRGRKMVDAMLVYIEARHRDWFWKGLQGARYGASFLRY